GSASHFMPSLGFVWFVSLGGRPRGLVGLVHCPGYDPGPRWQQGSTAGRKSPALQCPYSVVVRKKETRTSRLLPLVAACGWWGSNPHVLRHRDLNPARLPVPPHPLAPSPAITPGKGSCFCELCSAFNLPCNT